MMIAVICLGIMIVVVYGVLRVEISTLHSFNQALLKTVCMIRDENDMLQARVARLERKEGEHDVGNDTVR